MLPLTSPRLGTVLAVTLLLGLGCRNQPGAASNAPSADFLVTAGDSAFWVSTVDGRIRMRRAIIVDVDETVLDNSRYQGMLITRGVNYPEGWTDWCNRAEATAIPGAVEFLKYAHSRGVRVFYVTNRKIAEKDGTARNLKAVGFPEVNDETLLVRTDTQSDSKEPRRQSIASRYHVVLLMGDNLNDFSDVFEKSKTVAARLDATEKNRSQFGTHFIVLPNAMYGDWENAIYEYNFKLSSEEKQAKRRALLKD